MPRTASWLTFASRNAKHTRLSIWSRFWILRGFSGGLAPCGCLHGTYEICGGRVVTVIDERAPDCTLHVADEILAQSRK
jgi:hypothetical protein